jgi:hypothetical protein
VPAFTYITFLQARQALAARLYDPAEIFWTDPELKLYLLEALRTWNALTGFWVADYVRTVTNASPTWLTLNTAGSPRIYTLTTADLYAIVLYHLMEPQLAAGVWTGTSMYTAADLTGALERRNNEILTLGAANVSQFNSLVITAGTRTVVLPDTTLDIRRARYLPVTGARQTLWRGDPGSFYYFTPGYRQSPQTPRNYALSDRPPLTLDMDFPPAVNGSLDLLITHALTLAALPANTAMVIPDDWVWVLKWGMLMDLFNKQGEPLDALRSQYATVRYAEGIQLLYTCPWLLSAEINNVPAGIENAQERDTFDPGWEDHANARPGVITAGIDLVSLCPRIQPSGPSVGLTLEVVEAAPVPVLDGDFVQVPRDALDVILDYAIHLAAFKQGGAEFQQTLPLFDNFRTAAGLYNRKIANLGLYDDILKRNGKRLESMDPRYA